MKAIEIEAGKWVFNLSTEPPYVRVTRIEVKGSSELQEIGTHLTFNSIGDIIEKVTVKVNGVALA